MSAFLTLRVDPDLLVAVDDAAEAAGMKRSEWCRAVLYGAVIPNGHASSRLLIADAALQGEPPSVSQTPVLRPPHRPETVTHDDVTQRPCWHPPKARVVRSYMTSCGVCGERLR